MKPAAIMSLNKIITTLGKQSWLGFETLWPTLQGRVTRKLQTCICETGGTLQRALTTSVHLPALEGNSIIYKLH
jgi:hypothetical protein